MPEPISSMWRFITDFGDTAVTIPLALLMAVFLLAARQTRLAVGWTLAIAACAGAIGLMKLLLLPCVHTMFSSELSSPSGHTAMGTAVYGGFAAIVGARLQPGWRHGLTLGAAALMIAIAVSRAVLHFHSPIEIVVGFGVGLATLGAIVAIVMRYRPGPLPLAWLAAGALAIAVLFHGDRWATESAIHRLAGFLDFLRPWCG